MPDPNSYQAIGWLLVGLAGLVHLYNQIRRAVDGMREVPPPAQTYVTKLDCARTTDGISKRVERLEFEVGAIRADMKADREAIMEAGERRKNELITAIHESVSGVHKRVDRILESMATKE